MSNPNKATPGLTKKKRPRKPSIAVHENLKKMLVEHTQSQVAEDPKDMQETDFTNIFDFPYDNCSCLLTFSNTTPNIEGPVSIFWDFEVGMQQFLTDFHRTWQ